MIIFRNIPREKCPSSEEQLLHEDSLVLELAAMESKVWVDGAGVGWCWSSHKVRGHGRQYHGIMGSPEPN